MTDDEKLLKKRFRELHDRAEKRSIPVYSDFLNMAEQDTLLSLGLYPPPALDGGYPGAERALARFGMEDGRFPPPAACLLISPRSARFAEKLTHRDFLGALMSLGVRRETLGDIVVTDKSAYLFCLETVADFLCAELREVRKTPVRCERTAVPDSLLTPEPEERELVVASKRADALIAAVYKLSRSEAQALFSRGYTEP